jgi:hypothetical protein
VTQALAADTSSDEQLDDDVADSITTGGKRLDQHQHVCDGAKLLLTQSIPAGRLSLVKAWCPDTETARFGSFVGNPNQLRDLGIWSDSRPTTSAARSKNLHWAIEAETLLNQVDTTATPFVESATCLEPLARLKELQPNR